MHRRRLIVPLIWTASLAVPLCPSACLESREPAQGRHLVVDRDTASVTFSHAGSVEVGRAILYFDREPTAATIDDPFPLPTTRLSTVSPDGGTPRVLASGVQSTKWDQKGRLLVQQRKTQVTAELFRIEPVSGEVEDFGEGGGLNDFGNWLVVSRPVGDGSFEQSGRRDDGTTVELGTGMILGVVSDVFYVETFDQSPDAVHDVHAITSLGEDKVIVSDVSWAQVTSSTVRPQLLLARPSRTSGAGSLKYDVSVRSLEFDDERVVAPMVDYFAGGTVSPNGTLLAIATRTAGVITVHVVSSNASDDRTVELPPPDPSFVISGMYNISWRPGSTDLWMFDEGRSLTLVLRPGEPLIRIDQMEASIVYQHLYQRDVTQGVIDDWSIDSGSGPFVGDGSYWLALGEDGLVHLNQATNPTAPPGPPFVVPGSNPTAVFELGPDSYLLLVQVANDRNDLYWSAPSKGTTRRLGERVGTIAYGNGRVLALSKYPGEAYGADLTLYDVARGTSTLVAQNVYEFALAPCATCGPVDRGTPIVYAIHAAQPYPFDGVWVGTLP
jgi:hypothetical protein